ncbi:hypothetical protein SAY86_029696 [Trapa natans]|uniref:Uncharacterized protein n=1 Tax=Trapa natans TaxID=22666 RepID=A0AAN7M1P2_TRANT|nr:hypothetical protein SAY86_029696 [Trapa natans]
MSSADRFNCLPYRASRDRQRPHARKQREAPHRRLRDQPFPDKPFDDWQVKRALLDYLKNCPSISLAVPKEDVEIARVKDLKKRKRDEPLASDIELTLDPRAYCNSSEAPRNGCSRRGRREPDAIVLEGFLRGGFPSKAIIVDYTYYLPGIWNISVAEDNDFCQYGEEEARLVSGLNCKIVAQFEKFKDFHNALKVLCGCSMQKQGSRLLPDYEASWDKDGFFWGSRSQNQVKLSELCHRSEAPKC